MGKPQTDTWKTHPIRRFPRRYTMSSASAAIVHAELVSQPPEEHGLAMDRPNILHNQKIETTMHHTVIAVAITAPVQAALGWLLAAIATACLASLLWDSTGN